MHERIQRLLVADYATPGNPATCTQHAGLALLRFDLDSLGIGSGS